MGIKIQGDIDTTVFFLTEDKNIFNENNHWFNLNKRSETDDGFITYEYVVPQDYQFKVNSRGGETLSNIFKQKDNFDLLVEIFVNKVDWSFSSTKGTGILSFRIAQFEIVDFNSNRELYEWGNEKRISETESMVIRYGKVCEHNGDDFKGDLSNLLLSIRREMKLNNLGL
jgi:hypothetical protein